MLEFSPEEKASLLYVKTKLQGVLDEIKFNPDFYKKLSEELPISVCKEIAEKFVIFTDRQDINNDVLQGR